MRCRTCDYPLWNLKARQCPECGAAFTPSQYEFVINSVQFCCPNCEQPYYGTGVKGHLVPQEFNCVSCARRLAMDEMVVRPADGVQEQQTQLNEMPWLTRQKHEWFKRWLRTVGKSMTSPGMVMRGVPLESGMGPAWLYATLTLFTFLMLGGGLPCLIVALILASSQSRDAMAFLTMGVVFALCGTIAHLLLIAIWGLITHGLLRMTGQTRHSLGRTYQAILYSVGTLAPLGIPCIGPLFGSYLIGIWWIVAAILMLIPAQSVSGGRATLAILTAPALALLVMMTAYGFLLYGAVNSVSRSGAPAVYVTSIETQNISAAVRAYAATHGGTGPAHSAELILHGLGSANFISSSFATDGKQIRVGETKLDKLEFLPANRSAAAVQAAAEALPPGTIAHRLGDFVFTYHGIDLSNCDRSLWIAICAPDPDLNRSIPLGHGITVAQSNGQVYNLGGNASASLKAQNALRAQFNLPPLPDPYLVTHDKPALQPASPGATGN